MSISVQLMSCQVAKNNVKTLENRLMKKSLSGSWKVRVNGWVFILLWHGKYELKGVSLQIG